MKNPNLKLRRVDFINEEEMEWLNLTPKERILETTKLWELYISLGGNLDPEPDPNSPFYFKNSPS
jgi:hypothetical protein